MPDPVLLASASIARAALLKNAGLEFEILPARVDEEELKRSLKASGASAAETAIALARQKALKISRARPDILVIGADQMLDCNGVWFDKPEDLEQARAHLLSLRGKTHFLENATCVAKGGAIIWHYSNRAKMQMRVFSDAFLDQYLDQVGDAVMTSVGAYHLEGTGAQLFDGIEGDFFSILGLPLLPLLNFLRAHDVIIE